MRFQGGQPLGADMRAPHRPHASSELSSQRARTHTGAARYYSLHPLRYPARGRSFFLGRTPDSRVLLLASLVYPTCPHVHSTRFTAVGVSRGPCRGSQPRVCPPTRYVVVLYVPSAHPARDALKPRDRGRRIMSSISVSASADRSTPFSGVSVIPRYPLTN